MGAEWDALGVGLHVWPHRIPGKASGTGVHRTAARRKAAREITELRGFVNGSDRVLAGPIMWRDVGQIGSNLMKTGTP